MSGQATEREEDDEYRYLYVKALLLYWEEGEPAFLDELNVLEGVLRADYKFATEPWPIPANGPLEALTEKLMMFLKDNNSSPETLLIIYYAGHAKTTAGKHMEWTRNRGPGPSLRWSSLQQHLFYKRADILLILDCCSAASTVDERQDGMCEALLACDIGGRTPVSGEHCFTRKLVQKLKGPSRKKAGVKVYDLYYDLLREYKLSGQKSLDASPQHLLQGKQERTILLRRMESFYTCRTSPTRKLRTTSFGTVEALRMTELVGDGPASRAAASIVSSYAASTHTAKTSASVMLGHAVFRGDDSSDYKEEYEVQAPGDMESGEPSASDDPQEGPAPGQSAATNQTASEADRVFSEVVDQNESVVRSFLESTREDWNLQSTGRRHLITNPIFAKGKNFRIIKEISYLQRDSDFNGEFFTLAPISHSDIFEWQATIRGPPGSPYEGGVFFVRLSLKDTDYPFAPPNTWFHTPIYHPNITSEGAICLDILADQWSPRITMRSIVISLSALMDCPNFAEPVDESAHIGAEGQETPEIFKRKAQEWTEKYAMGTRVL